VSSLQVKCEKVTLGTVSLIRTQLSITNSHDASVFTMKVLSLPFIPRKYEDGGVAMLSVQ
jgi:hypothetical protein